MEAGLLERRRYTDSPPREEYLLTPRGEDFRPVLLTLLDWGNRHFAPEGPSVQIVDAATGAPAEPVLVDRATLRPIEAPKFRLVAGPAAGRGMKARLARERSRDLLGPKEISA